MTTSVEAAPVKGAVTGAGGAVLSHNPWERGLLSIFWFPGSFPTPTLQRRYDREYRQDLNRSFNGGMTCCLHGGFFPLSRFLPHSRPPPGRAASRRPQTNSD